MNIVYKKLEDLKVYENNTKIHTDEQIEQIKKSIEKVGFLDPVGIDENGMIIEGHGRYLAAKKIGMKEIPCVELLGLDETQKRVYIIAHNKLTMNTGFDFDKMNKELTKLKEIDTFDFESMGLSLDDVDFYTEELDYSDLVLDETKPKTKAKKKTLTCPKCKHVWEG